MSDFLRDYLTVVWFGAIALLLAGLLLGISALVRPNKPSVEKLTAYESGVDPVAVIPFSGRANDGHSVALSEHGWPS